MRPVPRIALLFAALVLPVVAVLASFVLTDGPRAPQVPAEVRIGSSPGPSAPPLAPSATTPPAELPPPPPDDDDDDDGPDDDD